MPVYVHHSKKEPDFAWDQGKIAGLLAQVRYNQGRFCGRLEGLGTPLREEAQWQVYSQDELSFADARFAAMIRDAARQYGTPLTIDRLFRWHSELYSSVEKTMVKTKVHFQSSAGEGSESKLNKLIHWVNSTSDTDAVIKAAVAQLWLVIIRPFEAGNQRLGELVMESLLARTNQSGERFYSVTGQMRVETREYETFLSARPGNPGQPGNPPDATPWIEWFLGCMGRAIAQSDATMIPILEKHRFWERCAGMALSDRQRMVLAKLLDGQETKLTSSKWAMLTNTSQDTAGRDINDLVRNGILTRQVGGGRSTSYTIAWTH